MSELIFRTGAAMAALTLCAGCSVFGGGGSSSTSPRPFGGKPHAIPGVIEAEDFDEGGPGVAHHDLDPENQGAPYRKTSVDVEARPDASNGHGVGWTRGGEWLVYTVAVAAPGTYSVEIPVASAGKGGTFHLQFDGQKATGPISVPDTGGWQKLKVIRAGPIQLKEGVQVMRLSLDTDGDTRSVGDIDLLRFRREP